MKRVDNGFVNSPTLVGLHDDNTTAIHLQNFTLRNPSSRSNLDLKGLRHSTILQDTNRCLLDNALLPPRPTFRDPDAPVGGGNELINVQGIPRDTAPYVFRLDENSTSNQGVPTNYIRINLFIPGQSVPSPFEIRVNAYYYFLRRRMFDVSRGNYNFEE